MTDDATLTVTFRKPIEYKSITYEKVDLREPTAGELAETSGLIGYSADIAIISAVGAMPDGAVKLMPATEFTEAARFIGRFITPAPETGASA